MRRRRWRGGNMADQGKLPSPGLAIVADVARQHDLAPYWLLVPDGKGGARRKPVAVARFHAMAELRTRLNWSYPRIGRLLGGRDHTAVMHGVKRWQALQAEGAGL